MIECKHTFNAKKYMKWLKMNFLKESKVKKFFLVQ